MKIISLIEDDKRSGTSFIAEHGLSLYFEHAGKRILFDTGASDSFIYNATLLGINLSKVDVCIISHAHRDHCGGLEYFLKINNRAKIYMKKQAEGDFYTKRAFRYYRTGLDPEVLARHIDRIEFIEQDTEVSQGVFAANIIKHRQYPNYSSLMYIKKDGDYLRDDLNHELFVAVKDGEGALVLTGCSHNGILNILMTAQEKYGKIKGVVGGFHLGGGKHHGVTDKKEPEFELRAIADYINKNKIKNVYTGHCTGEKQAEKLELLARAKKIYSGDIIEI